MSTNNKVQNVVDIFLKKYYIC